MIDTVLREDIQELLALSGPCVSIYIPTAPTGRDRLAGPVRLKNQIERAHDMLVELGRRSTLVWDLLKPLSNLVDDEKFWIHQSHGLAFFLTDDFFRVFRLRVDVPELTIVGPTFHIRPVLPCLEQEEAFILALDGQETRLIKVIGEHVEEVEIPELPRSIEDALGPEYAEKQRQMHSVGPRGQGGSVSHGAGDQGAEVKDRDLRFCQAIDRVLTHFMNGGKRPLILAADEPIAGIFRHHCHYGHLMADGIPGNPRRISRKDLALKAMPLLEVRKQEANLRLLERLEEARPALTSESSLEQILNLATQGRVEILFADPHAVTWGVMADDGRPVITPEQGPNSEDLINRAAIATLKGRGTVVEMAPPDTVIGTAALLRY